MRGVVHHVDLTVSDPEASFSLYNTILTFLGYHLARKNGRGYGWELDSPAGSHSVDIVKASVDGMHSRHDRYSPGLHHLAWTVESREAVDQIHDLLSKSGATILDPPADYPQYNKGRGYYAVFFADQDGLKLECVYTPVPGAL